MVNAQNEYEPRETISGRVRPWEKRRLEELAAERRWSVSAYVAWVIEQHLTPKPSTNTVDQPASETFAASPQPPTSPRPPLDPNLQAKPRSAAKPSRRSQ